MPSLYDRLSDQLGDDDPSGITPLDIADLPDTQRRIMFYLLRSRDAEAGGVPRHVLHDQFSDVEDLAEVLDELAEKQWVIVSGEPPKTFYKVNLRRKRGHSEKSLWSSLASRLFDDDDET